MASELPKQYDPRPDLRRDPIEPELVDLEQAKLTVDPVVVDRAKQRGRDPAAHAARSVGPRANLCRISAQ